MRLFTEELAGTTLVSIAHRPGMDAFHDRTLTLEQTVGGARLVTRRRRSRPQKASAAREAPMQREARRLANLMLQRLRSAR